LASLELWGGCECTVNRVGDRWFDQTIRTGRETRLSDLALFADLGMKAFRLPILWERTAPDHPETRDFTWPDTQLAELTRLGMRPIAGLTHHGSGPHYTNLLDDGFAPGLATHARAVAERYPWIEDWTPVNEPLTTSRFSCLYGYWYPHARDDKSWIAALLNQIDAVRLSMREVRKVNPKARLVQTEDLGFVHATSTLDYQAEFENERRWLTWDLLEGRVTRDHAMYAWLTHHGFADRLAAIADDPCAADVIGVNHYLTSERFLDERVQRYPGITPGGNGRTHYVDVEAVRVAEDGPLGLEELLRQTWARYGKTIAVTEVHNGSTRDEQMRWFHEAWRGCETLRDEGVDVEGVTAWSLLGACDWVSLLTREDGHYECGVFDLSGGAPRPTAMAGLLKALAEGREPEEHAVALASPGWWRRNDIRFEYEPARSATAERSVVHAPYSRRVAPLLIAGAGPLARAFVRQCRLRGLPHVVVDAHERADPWALERVIAKVSPSALIDVTEHGGAPEEHAPHELRIAPLTDAGDAPGVLHIPVEGVFCGDDPACFATRALDALVEGRPFEAPDDVEVAPTFRPHLADAALDLLIDGACGRWRLAGPTRLSWAAFARRLADAAGLDASLVEPTRSAAPLHAADALWDGHAPLPALERAIDRFIVARAERAARAFLYAA
jgi:dTDP-4-dehydrorhamnose reductase